MDIHWSKVNRNGVLVLSNYDLLLCVSLAVSSKLDFEKGRLKDVLQLFSLSQPVGFLHVSPAAQRCGKHMGKLNKSPSLSGSILDYFVRNV